MKRILYAIVFSAGCGGGTAPTVAGEASVVIDPQLVGEAPDCDDVGGAPAAALPARIHGAADDLRAFLLGDGSIACVGLVEVGGTDDEGPGEPIDEPAPTTPDQIRGGVSPLPGSAEMNQEDTGEAPPLGGSGCSVCGKDPEPMGPGDPVTDTPE